MKRTSIRIKILTNFLIVIAMTASALIGTQYYFAESMAISAAKNSFAKVFDAISAQTAFDAKSSRTYLHLAAGIEDIDMPVTHDNQHAAAERLIESLNLHPKAYATEVTHQNGDLFRVISIKHNPQLVEVFETPEETAWVTITVSTKDKHKTQRWSFLTEDLQTISQRTVKNHYVPTARAWFKHALEANKIISTPPYLIGELGEPAITFAKKIPGSYSVISLDFTLSKLQEMLREQMPTDDTEIFVFNKQGKVFFDANAIKAVKPLWQEVEPISLTQTQQKFINENPLLYVSSQQSWAPFDYVEFGISKGYSIDLLELMALKTGLNLQYVSGYKWYETINSFKQGQLDIVQSIYASDKRKQFGQFSNPYLNLEHFFISRQDITIEDFNDLKGKIVALPYGWKINDFLRENYPNIIVQTYPNMISSLKAVSTQKAHASIDTYKAAQFLIKQYKIADLKIGQPLPTIEQLNPQSLHFMVQPDQTVLLSIINQALAQITPEEQKKLNDKWGLFSQSLDASHVMVNHTIPAEMMALVEQGEFKEAYQIEFNGGTYLVEFRPVRLHKKDSSMIGIMVPKKTLMAPYTDRIKLSLFVALAVIVLVVPIVYLSTHLLVEPIKKLMALNEHIKQRDYAKVKETPTVIEELHDLSVSLVDMSQSIQAYEKSQAELLDAIVQLIANAIDAKSPYTGAHCKRVPEIAFMLLDAVNADQSPAFKDYQLNNQEELRAFEIGAWLHDCGKVITPVHVVDKGTKLETIYNRIHEIRTRFEVLWRDAEIEYYQALLSGTDKLAAETTLNQKKKQLQQDFEFIALSNVGGEFMDVESQQRIEQIAQQSWQRHFDNRIGLSQIELDRFKTHPTALPVTESLLQDAPEHLIERTNFDHEAYQKQGFKEPVPEYLSNLGELTNLKIAKGTLTEEERFTIKEHVIHTIRMLNQLPLPKAYQRVPEYAGTHHETLTGTGYPRQLEKDDLSIPERIMVIADVFEALTASDRPYKQGKTLSESLKILSFMRNDQHIDAELFKVFLRSGVYRQYANKHLKPEQIDKINIEDYL